MQAILNGNTHHLLDRAALLERIPYSIVHIYRLMNRGEFPKPIRLGANRVAWLENEIDAWLHEKISSRPERAMSALAAAKEFLAKNIAIVPYPYGQKECVLPGWTKNPVNSKNVEDFFSQPKQNIAVLLGEYSGGLVDVDLDHVSARKLWPVIMPLTASSFGRPSAGITHLLYYAADIKKSSTFRSLDRGMLVELRSNKLATLVPPSYHEKRNESVAWHENGTPATVSGKELLSSVALLAFVSQVSVLWGSLTGKHNSCALALAGTLLGAGVNIEMCEKILRIIAEEGNDTDVEKRVGVVACTAKKIADRQPVTGFAALCEDLGEGYEKLLGKWLKLFSKQQHNSSLAETESIPPFITELNNKHSFVILGGKAAISTAELVGRQTTYSFMEPSAFHQFYENRKGMDVDNKLKPITKIWMGHESRGTYSGVCFDPLYRPSDKLNLYQSLACEPVSGNCEKILSHIRNVVCRGNNDHNIWFISWLAHNIQNPAEKPGTAIAIRGKQGTGKSILVELYGSLFGIHYVVVSNGRFITSHFNDHLSKAIILHAEEAFWAGEKAAEGIIKDIITGSTMKIERKRKDPEDYPNYIRLMVTSNSSWVVPAGLEERRFAVFETSDEKMKNGKYFAALAEEIENGGREAFLDYLLKWNASQVDLRKIPLTDALLEQKYAGMTGSEGWWLGILQNGVLPGDWLGQGLAPFHMLTDDYISHARKVGLSRRSCETILGGDLKRLSPPCEKSGRQKRMVYTKEGGWSRATTKVRAFPPLAECRDHFNALFGGQINWEEPMSWCADERLTEHTNQPQNDSAVQHHHNDLM